MAYGNPPRRLYVLEMVDGVIKGGIARGSAEERIRQHKAAHPGEVLRHFIAPRYVTGIEAERALLACLAGVGRLVRGREWFAGVTFDQAVEFARQVADQFCHPDQMPAASPLLRTGRGNLSFNDKEIAVLDAYCARFGKERSVACRELAMGAVVEMLSGHGAKNFAPSAT
jgi:hypothetical protein